MITPLLDLFLPGKTVYIPGATGEINALGKALAAEPERARGVHFVSCFVPGMNEFDYAGLDPAARVTTFMLPRAMQTSFQNGRVDILPRTYSAIPECLAAMAFDIAIAHVAAPGPDGLCSFGICSDFTPPVWEKAALKVAFINPDMPSMPRGPRLNLQEADLVLQAPSALVTAQPNAATGPNAEIARLAAELIPDGASLQTGIGGAPGGIWDFLKDHKDLTLRSGMAHDGLRGLYEAGALAAEGHHVAGIAYGSAAFYHYLAQSDLVDFVTTRQSHGIEALARVERLHSINSALEVDLFGQINVEWQNGRMLSGVGGGPDFARAAMTSPGGRSIIALPATAKKGAVSRIVPTLSSPTSGIARSDIDTVITQHGIAELRYLSMDKRAEALISIAEPAFQTDLGESWRRMRSAM